MKNRIVPIIAAIAAFPITAAAATIFNGGDLATDGNWTNNRPTTVGNFGTVNVNGTVSAASATPFNQTFYWEQTGGIISHTGSGADPTLNGGTFTQSGGTWGTSSGRGFKTTNGNVTTLQSGSIIGGDKSSTTLTGSTMIVNGGSFQQLGARSVILSGDATLTINGGTFSVNDDFGIGRLSTGNNNAINLNGGAITVTDDLRFGDNGALGTFHFGGTVAGSLTAADFVAAGDDSENIAARRVNWLTGSLMTMTLTTALSNWAETEWAAGRLTYNGQGVGALGNWATVTTTGFGDNRRFNYDGTTKALSLAVVPEPASLAMLGLGGLAMLRRRRGT